MMRRQAIVNLYSEVAKATDEGGYDKNGNLVAIDEAKVQVEQERLQAVYNAQAYARSRHTEYPSLQDCIHAILDNELEALQVKRQAVKTKYPKP